MSNFVAQRGTGKVLATQRRLRLCRRCGRHGAPNVKALASWWFALAARNSHPRQRRLANAAAFRG